MADVLEKVRRLIALTSSDNENEARNAAFLACKLIREHGIQVSLNGVNGSKKAPSPPPRPKTVDDFFNDFFGNVAREHGKDPTSDEFEEFRRRAAEEFEGFRRKAEKRARAHEDPIWEAESREAYRDAHRQGKPYDGEDCARVIKTKYDGKCRVCGRLYIIGDWVVWRKGRGCACNRAECRIGVFEVKEDRDGRSDEE